jgi:hypothetical protein
MPQSCHALFATAITICFVVPVMGSSVSSNETQRPSNVTRVEAVNPFTRFAYIPEGADVSSIRFEGAKTVKVATQKKSTTDVRYCEEAMQRDPGGSMYCHSAQFQAPMTAWQVTYSYQGQPMASEEFGNGNFTFSVYLHPSELSPTARENLSGHRVSKADAASLFDLRTSRDPVRRVVINETASTFCEGRFVDGLWMNTDAQCEDSVSYTTIVAPSTYITVSVYPALARAGEHASR